jgi:hypothetical protein
MRKFLHLLAICISINSSAQIAWQQNYGIGNVQQVEQTPEGYALISLKGSQFYHATIDSLGNLLTSQALPFQDDAVYFCPDGKFLTVNYANRLISKQNAQGQVDWQWVEDTVVNLNHFFAAQLPDGRILTTSVYKTVGSDPYLGIYSIKLTTLNQDGLLVSTGLHMNYVRSTNLSVLGYHSQPNGNFIVHYKPFFQIAFGNQEEYAELWNEQGYIRKFIYPLGNGVSLEQLKFKRFLPNKADDKVWFLGLHSITTLGGHGARVNNQFISYRDAWPDKEIFRRQYRHTYQGMYYHEDGPFLFDGILNSNDALESLYLSPNDSTLRYELMSEDLQVLRKHPLKVPCSFKSDVCILGRTTDGGFFFRSDSILVKLGLNGYLPDATHQYQLKLLVDIDEDCATPGVKPYVADLSNSVEFESLDGQSLIVALPDSTGTCKWLSSNTTPFKMRLPKRLKDIEYVICSGTDIVLPDQTQTHDVVLALGSSTLIYQTLSNPYYTFDSMQNTSLIPLPFTISKNATVPLRLRGKGNETQYKLNCLPGVYHIKNDTFPQHPLEGWSVTETDTLITISAPNTNARVKTFHFPAQRVLDIKYYFDQDHNCIRSMQDTGNINLVQFDGGTVTDLRTGNTYPFSMAYELKLSALYEYEFRISPINSNILMPCSNGMIRYTIPYNVQNFLPTDPIFDVAIDPHSYFRDSVIICDTFTQVEPPFWGLPYFPWMPDTLSLNPLEVYMRHIVFSNPSITYISSTVQGTSVPPNDTIYLQNIYGCDSTVINTYLSDLDQIESISDQISISPNPFTDQLQIEVQNHSVKDYLVQLIDLQGNTILECQWNSFEKLSLIDLKLRDGAYLLCLRQISTGALHTKLVLCMRK